MLRMFGRHPFPSVIYAIIFMIMNIAHMGEHSTIRTWIMSNVILAIGFLFIIVVLDYSDV